MENRIADLPLRREAVRRAFEHFRETGELPEQQRPAAVVTTLC